MTPTPPSRLSPSGAGTFEQCPRRWRMKYVERRPDPPGEAALAGSFAHRVLELLMQRPAADRTIEMAKQIARREWPLVETDGDFVALGYEADQAKAFRWKAWKAVAALWSLENPAEVEVHATERDVEAVLGGVPFRGIVDRLEREGDGLVITDYKSGRAPSPRYRRGRLDQVLLYAAAVTEADGEMPVRARLLFLGGDRPRPVGIDVTPAEIDGVVAKLAGTWSDLNEACATDTFAPRTGPLCGWCPYVGDCPEGTAEVARRQGRIDAQEAAAVAAAAEAGERMATRVA